MYVMGHLKCQLGCSVIMNTEMFIGIIMVKTFYINALISSCVAVVCSYIFKHVDANEKFLMLV